MNIRMYFPILQRHCLLKTCNVRTASFLPKKLIPKADTWSAFGNFLSRFYYFFYHFYGFFYTEFVYINTNIIIAYFFLFLSCVMIIMLLSCFIDFLNFFFRILLFDSIIGRCSFYFSFFITI